MLAVLQRRRWRIALLCCSPSGQALFAPLEREVNRAVFERFYVLRGMEAGAGALRISISRATYLPTTGPFLLRVQINSLHRARGGARVRSTVYGVLVKVLALYLMVLWSPIFWSHSVCRVGPSVLEMSCVLLQLLHKIEA